MVTPAAEQKAVAHLVDAYGMSERRACITIGCCRMTMRYQTTRADDAALRQRMKAIAHERLSESDTRGRARDARPLGGSPNFSVVRQLGPLTLSTLARRRATV